MSDTFFTARRVRIGLRIVGFFLAFFAVVGALTDFLDALFGPEDLFSMEFLRTTAMLGIAFAAGMFLILRAKDLAAFLAEDHES